MTDTPQNTHMGLTILSIFTLFCGLVAIFIGFPWVVNYISEQQTPLCESFEGMQTKVCGMNAIIFICEEG